MKVFNLIHTVVSPGDSPWGKTGAHTIFYPTDLMSKGEADEIGKRIYFPETNYTKVDTKETVFYQKIQNEYYLVILHFRYLPDARDSFGRSGIFLCHGFIFPPELWKEASEPLALFGLVKDKVFKTREDMLASSLVNRKTGNILPVEVPQEKTKNITNVLPPLNSEFEWKLTVLLNNFANSEKQKPFLLFKGVPEDVSALMSKLSAYVPRNLMINIGWDASYDGGSLTFFPLKIVGFKDANPSGGDQILVDLKTRTIKDTPETAQLFIPHTPYEHWLYHCRNEIRTKDQIEEAYQLSCLLEGKPVQLEPQKLSVKSGFVSANQKTIRDVFLKRCGELVSQTLAQHIANLLTAESMLNLLIENLPMSSLARAVEAVLIKNRLSPKTHKITFSDSLVNAGSHRLKCIANVWKGKKLKLKDIAILKADEQIEFIKYLLLTEWIDEDWVIDLLREDEGVFNQLLSSHDTKEAVEKILLEVIASEKNFRDIERLLLRNMLRQGRGFDLLKGQINLMEVLEGFLKECLWSEGEMEECLSWVRKKKLPKGDFPYIKAFLFPEYGIPECVLRDVQIKRKLIDCLIKHHDCKTRNLLRLGFNKNDIPKIQEEEKSTGMTGLVKGLFGFGRQTKKEDNEIPKKDAPIQSNSREHHRGTKVTEKDDDVD